MAGPDSPPPAGPDPRTGRLASTSMAMASTVLTRVTPSAPAERAAPATSAMSETVGLSFAHRGSAGQCLPTAATTSAVAVAEWANTGIDAEERGQAEAIARN